jgi:hypothetical protein
VIRQIVSGGQTGVDRAALDFAIKYGIDYFGFIPRNRRAEDGRIPDTYTFLVETESYDYRVRTVKNLIYADGTLIIYRYLIGGTRLTYQKCKELGKPLYLIAINKDFDFLEEREKFNNWLKNHRVSILNVAGNRESEAQGIYGVSFRLLERLLLPLEPKDSR